MRPLRAAGCHCRQQAIISCIVFMRLRIGSRERADDSRVNSIPAYISWLRLHNISEIIVTFGICECINVRVSYFVVSVAPMSTFHWQFWKYVVLFAGKMEFEGGFVFRRSDFMNQNWKNYFFFLWFVAVVRATWDHLVSRVERKKAVHGKWIRTNSQRSDTFDKYQKFPSRHAYLHTRTVPAPLCPCLCLVTTIVCDCPCIIITSFICNATNHRNKFTYKMYVCCV